MLTHMTMHMYFMLVFLNFFKILNIFINFKLFIYILFIYMTYKIIMSCQHEVRIDCHVGFHAKIIKKINVLLNIFF